MTATFSLHFRLIPAAPVATPCIVPKAVVAVVAAFNDQDGLNSTLSSLDRLGLSRIIVVDDGSMLPLRQPEDLLTPLLLLRHATNKGAASARNTGLAATDAEWIYFTDCGCSHPENLLDLFAQFREQSGQHTSAIVGPVEAGGNGRLATYYTHQGTLNAPVIVEENGNFEVETIVTANAIVSRRSLSHVGGFDETFPSAGGEDTDLGLRLRSVGNILWCSDAVVLHKFEEDLGDFDARMHRYGRGMRFVSDKFGFDLRPRPFKPFDHSFIDLAERQYRMMLLGFDG